MEQKELYYFVNRDDFQEFGEYTSFVVKKSDFDKTGEWTTENIPELWELPTKFPNCSAAYEILDGTWSFVFDNVTSVLDQDQEMLKTEIFLKSAAFEKEVKKYVKF